MAISSNGVAGLKTGVCTSTTRPSGPYEGQMIYETDTDMVAIWNGTAWRYISATTPTNGTVLQVVSTTITNQPSTTTNSLTDISGFNVSITPKSASSKILITCNMMMSGSGTDDTWHQLVRNSTNIAVGSNGTTNSTLYIRIPDGLLPVVPSITFLDSPATTSAITYKMQWRTRVGTLYLNTRAYDMPTVSSTGISTITAMEIAG
jgi:hypothetical protein